MQMRSASLEVDFETGEVKPTASLNCDNSYLAKFRTSLWASENPIVSALQNPNPSILPHDAVSGGPIYAYPMIYRSSTRCWEAERERRQDCLAIQNSRVTRKLQFEDQVCAACGMQAYATLVLAQLHKNTSEAHLEQLRALAARANGYLSRLFKVEHYYNRMRDMEVTIARLQAVVQNHAHSVSLTDRQHRVITPKKTPTRFFPVPEAARMAAEPCA